MKTTGPELTLELEEAIRKRFVTNNNFPSLLGIELDSIDLGRAHLSLKVTDQLMQAQGVMHGGVIASLIDTAVALAIASSAGAASRFTTVDMTIHYLAPVIDGTIYADARVIRQGKRIVSAECEVTDQSDKPVARAMLTYIFVGSRS